jgi:hypothetical protein
MWRFASNEIEGMSATTVRKRLCEICGKFEFFVSTTNPAPVFWVEKTNPGRVVIN